MPPAAYIELASAPVVTFFGSTCAPEIELYGRGSKLVSKLPCAPCYKRDCPNHEKEACMTEMRPDAIFAEAKRILEPALGAKAR